MPCRIARRAPPRTMAPSVRSCLSYGPRLEADPEVTYPQQPVTLPHDIGRDERGLGAPECLAEGDACHAQGVTRDKGVRATVTP
jgi:hypothetical protein